MPNDPVLDRLVDYYIDPTHCDLLVASYDELALKLKIDSNNTCIEPLCYVGVA